MKDTNTEVKELIQNAIFNTYKGNYRPTMLTNTSLKKPLCKIFIMKNTLTLM